MKGKKKDGSRDFAEVMLLSEGFSAYTRLSRKLVALYRIAKNILTDKNHYDWSLRNLKMAIEGAGLLKRGWRSEAEKTGGQDEDLLNADAAQKLTDMEEAEEERIIRKAVVDFNIAKLASDDSEVFSALVEGFLASPEEENRKWLAANTDQIASLIVCNTYNAQSCMDGRASVVHFDEDICIHIAFRKVEGKITAITTVAPLFLLLLLCACVNRGSYERRHW